MNRVLHRVASLGFLAALGALGGCLSDYVPVDRSDVRPQEMQVTHSVGGTHWRTFVEGGVWYQGFGSTLYALNPKNGANLDNLACMPMGKSGALVDLVVFQHDLIGVLDRTAVIRVDRTNPGAMMVVEIIGERALGVRPEQLSVADGGLYVSGLGGVIRLDTGERFLGGSVVCGRVVATRKGLATTRQGEIVLLADGSVEGRATDLQVVPSAANGREVIAFVDQRRDGARVGLLDGDFHELASVDIDGEVSRLRALDGRLWAVTPKGITSWKVTESGLSDSRNIRVQGALDIDACAPNTFAIAGTFGRALYRLDTDNNGPGDAFFAVTREPGRLERVLSDSRRIVAGSGEGNWLYLTGGSCEPSSNPIQTLNPPNARVRAQWGTATIRGADDDAMTIESAPSVVVDGAGLHQTLQMPQGAHARTLALVGGDLWIGHDDGIDVWRWGGATMSRVGRLRLQGPVTNLYPRRTDDGASWVSLFGGMGVAMWRPIDAPVQTQDAIAPAADRSAGG